MGNLVMRRLMVLVLAVGLALFLVAWGVLFGLQKSEMLQSSFIHDHIAKTALFAVTLEIMGLLAAGLEAPDDPGVHQRPVCLDPLAPDAECTVAGRPSFDPVLREAEGCELCRIRPDIQSFA